MFDDFSRTMVTLSKRDGCGVFDGVRWLWGGGGPRGEKVVDDGRVECCRGFCVRKRGKVIRVFGFSEAAAAQKPLELADSINLFQCVFLAIFIAGK